MENIKLNIINKIDAFLATKHKESFDLQTRFLRNKYVLTLSLFSAENYGNLWITPDILILVGFMGLFHSMWASSCMCVCVYVCWRLGRYDEMPVGTALWRFSGGHILSHWAHTMLVVVLFMFRKRKGESLHLYVSYDEYTMAEKFTLMTISFPQTLKTCYLKRLQ